MAHYIERGRNVLAILGLVAFSVGPDNPINSKAQDQFDGHQKLAAPTLALPHPIAASPDSARKSFTNESSIQKLLVSEGSTGGATYKYFNVRKSEWELHVEITGLDVNPNDLPTLSTSYFYADDTGGVGPMASISPEGNFGFIHRVFKALKGVHINGGFDSNCKGAVRINTLRGEILNTLKCN